MTKAAMNPNTKLQRSRDVIATDMDGEMVMMHIEKGTYFAMSGSGAGIWAALENPVLLSEVIAHVEREYDVSTVERLDATVAEFVEQLIAQGLVDVAD